MKFTKDEQAHAIATNDWVETDNFGPGVTERMDRTGAVLSEASRKKVRVYWTLYRRLLLGWDYEVRAVLFAGGCDWANEKAMREYGLEQFIGAPSEYPDLVYIARKVGDPYVWSRAQEQLGMDLGIL